MQPFRIWWRIVAVLTAVASLLVGTATAAQAEIKWCSGGGALLECAVSEQGYWSGGVQRSAVRGAFYGYAPPAGSHEITGWLDVRDVADNDGWRARAWVNIYMECLCVDAGYRVRSWTFDAFTSAWTHHDAPKVISPRFGFTYYTIQVIIGRYRGSTGQCDPANCGAYANHEQRFYLTLD
jgi:hypothetical protein